MQIFICYQTNVNKNEHLCTSGVLQAGVLMGYACLCIPVLINAKPIN